MKTKSIGKLVTIVQGGKEVTLPKDDLFDGGVAGELIAEKAMYVPSKTRPNELDVLVEVNK